MFALLPGTFENLVNVVQEIPVASLTAFKVIRSPSLKEFSSNACLKREVRWSSWSASPVVSKHRSEYTDDIQKILGRLSLDQPDWASPMIHETAHRQQN
ncbi:MAG: hypothetical protein ACFHX7_12805 [Pseudomonadota bacterium]